MVTAVGTIIWVTIKPRIGGIPIQGSYGSTKQGLDADKHRIRWPNNLRRIFKQCKCHYCQDNTREKMRAA